MFTFAAQIIEPVVGVDASHRDCDCLGLVVALPDGTLQLYAENVADLEALGWGILATAERIRSAATAEPADEAIPLQAQAGGRGDHG